MADLPTDALTQLDKATVEAALASLDRTDPVAVMEVAHMVSDFRGLLPEGWDLCREQGNRHDPRPPWYEASIFDGPSTAGRICSTPIDAALALLGALVRRDERDSPFYEPMTAEAALAELCVPTMNAEGAIRPWDDIVRDVREALPHLTEKRRDRVVSALAGSRFSEVPRG